MSFKIFKSSRRKFIQMMASLPPTLNFTGTLSAREAEDRNDSWNEGKLAHFIPIANHENFLIKTSFRESLKRTPLLKINDRFVPGTQSDSQGYFWQFYAEGLKTNFNYELQITSSSRQALCDTWRLKTFPHPDAQVDSYRTLAYTCAGGNENILLEDGTRFFCH
jgi:hypothetical protein